MIYKKNKVTKRGEEAITRYRKVWLIIGIIILVVSLIAIPEYFFIESMREAVPMGQFITYEIIIFCFGVFAIIYSKIRKYNPLLEGCKDIERAIKKAINKYNRNSASIANKTSKQTGQAVSYSQCSTEFKAKELFDLLSKAEAVSYIGYPEVIVSSMKVIKKPSAPNTDTNHNFDDELSDEEFDDLMD